MAGFGRAQKASALLPLAVLSAAWTASLATAGSDASAGAAQQTLPDGTRVPAQAVRVPASVTAPHTLTRGLRSQTRRVVSIASASGIPAVALAAYQRAVTVIGDADRDCHLPWQLVAAIGRVESDHGRANGSTLTDAGIAHPGIYGPALDGRHGATTIRDTDAGHYDHDARFDRAVGPMQFIPSTWAIVGVDGDDDGQRNPQDIYDAALASAVYLCAGTDDLATTAGQNAAVFRYNHSRRYVALVIAIERAYLAGDYSAVPNGTTADGFMFGTPPQVSAAVHHPRHTRRHGDHQGDHGHHSTTTTTTADQPTTGPTGPSTTGPSSGPSTGPTSTSTGILPTTLATLSTSVPITLPTVLSTPQAIARCLDRGLVDDPLDPNDAFDGCVYDLTH